VAFDLLALLRKNREGIQRERTLRAVYLLLSGWCRFQDARNPVLAEPRGQMMAIPFDKLIMVFARFWDELFRRTGAKFKDKEPSSITEDEHKQAITFPVPFSELPGKHGAGRAVSGDDRPPEFLVSVLYRLREEDLLPYFDITPPRDAPKTPNDYRTTVEPALSSAADDALLEDFTECERGVLRDLGNAIKRLDAEEIRALGTHENFEKTAADVEREFRWMQRWVNEIEACINGGRTFLPAAQEALEYADEARRKSERNRGDYTKARSLVLAELSHENLKQVFGQCQKSDADIWDRPEMKELAKRARRVYARAHYVQCIAYFSVAEHQRGLARGGASPLEEVGAELAAEGIRGLPISLDKMLAGNGHAFLEGAKQKLLSVVAELKNP